MYHIDTLSNGLRVLTVPEPNASSTTALVLVRAGSRYESFEQNGISHFLEHMFFKGAKDFKTPKEVALSMDSIGGVFNAFTGKELAGYYVKTAKEHVETSLHVLSDMLIHSTFPEEEIKKEKGVILEEINMYLDSPRQQIGWDFERTLFGDQPLGWDEGGRPEWIKEATREEFLEYKEQHYSPTNSILVLSGNISREKALELSGKYFMTYTSSQEPKEYSSFNRSQLSKERLHLRSRQTDQAHFILGFEGVTRKSPQKYATQLLSTILGGNMSSRMFQHLREEKGLCYYVYTGASNYHDIGTFYTAAGVSLDKVKDAITAVEEEIASLLTNPITKEELLNAKNYLLGTLALSLEDTEEKGYFLGKQLLLADEIKDYDDLKKVIDSITLEEVHQCAEKINTLSPTLSIIGPFQEDDFSFFSV